MPIPITCKECGASFNVRDDFAGRRGKCPQCKAVIDIPAAKPTAPAAPFEPPAAPTSSSKNRYFDPPEPPRLPKRGGRPDATVPQPRDDDDFDDPLPSSKRRSARRDERDDDEYEDRRKPSRRRAKPPGSGMNLVFIANIILLVGGLFFLIGLFTLRSGGAFLRGDLGFYQYAALFFAVALVVGIVLATLGRLGVGQSDRTLAGSTGICVILGWIATGLLGLHALFVLIMVIGKVGSDAMAWIVLISRWSGMICLFVAEILFALAIMKLGNRLRHPSLRVFSLVMLIAFSVVGGLFLLTEIIGLSNSGRFTVFLFLGVQYAETVGLIFMFTFLIAFGAQIYPLLVAKSVLTYGYTPPPPRSFDEDDDRPRGRRREPEYDEDEDDRPRRRDSRGRGRDRDREDDY